MTKNFSDLSSSFDGKETCHDRDLNPSYSELIKKYLVDNDCDDFEVLWEGICYKRDKNPRHAWKSIARLGKINEMSGKKIYPKWIKEYLEDTAKNLLTKCDGKATGSNGIVACLGLKRINQLQEEKINETLKIMLMMDKIIFEQKISISEAAKEIEIKLYDSELSDDGNIKDCKGRKAGEKGYWGASKIRKEYSKDKKSKESIIRSFFRVIES